MKWSSARNTFLGKALCPLIREWTIWGKLLCVLRNWYRAVQIHLPLQKWNCCVTHLGTGWDEAAASSADQEIPDELGDQGGCLYTCTAPALYSPQNATTFFSLAACAGDCSKLPSLYFHSSNAVPELQYGDHWRKQKSIPWIQLILRTRPNKKNSKYACTHWTPNTNLLFNPKSFKEVFFTIYLTVSIWNCTVILFCRNHIYAFLKSPGQLEFCFSKP